MSVLGNIIWFVFGGLLMSASYFVCAITYCLTIIGIPVGIQLFKLSYLSLFPFGRKVVDKGGSMGIGKLLLNILWIVCGGLEMALAHVTLGVLFGITIIGIPFAKQHFKLAVLALMPFGKEIV